jgi:hypothetical protein
VDGQKEVILQSGEFSLGLKTANPKQMFYELQLTDSERSFAKKIIKFKFIYKLRTLLCSLIAVRIFRIMVSF